MSDGRPQTERKFLVDEETAAAFLARARAWITPEIHDPAAPISWTRTTYLDTTDRHYLRSGESGTSCRLRIREYAAAAAEDKAPILTGECWLETKESGGGERRKSRYIAPAETVAALLAASGLEPVVTTWYRRDAWRAGALRITVDRDLAWAEPCPIGIRGMPAEPPRIFARLASCVLEVKHVAAEPGWLAEALRPLGERSDFSKFRTGMLAKDGDQRFTALQR